MKYEISRIQSSVIHDELSLASLAGGGYIGASVGRAIAMARTKLDEARMWLREAEQALGEDE